METKKLEKNEQIDIERGYRYRYVCSDTEGFRPHSHNFYEVFLMMQGEAIHTVNGKEQHLSKGQLLFIRDFDVHTYRSANGDMFAFLNLTFTIDIFKSMAEYLGDGFSANDLTEAPYPPLVTLSDKDRERLFYSITTLESGDEKGKKVRFRSLLMNIFTQYFYKYSYKNNEIPLWLEMTYEKIKAPENFIRGTERLYDICPKSREHLCRSLKKYYGTSPCALVTDLRLEYSINLLITSNLSVTDICFECGFENVSWFYKVFENKYKTTPLKYRKKNNIQ